MATWTDVRRLALALPETTERLTRELRHWYVSDKLFVWERPLRKKDLDELGDAAPRGAVLGVRVDDLDAKDALLAADPRRLFTTAHFDGYPAILVRLEEIARVDLKRLIVDAWLARAPRAVAKRFVERGGR